MHKKIKNLIVGCGLSGIVLAERLANELGEDCLIIDRRHHIAGNIYDYDQDGITVHKYGPHAFHTNEKEIWHYLNKFTKFYPFNLKVSGFIDGQAVPIPFNLNSIDRLFPEFMAKSLSEKLIKAYGYNVKVPILELRKAQDPDLSFLADFVYKNVFEGYTIKQWNLKPEEINPSVMARVPIFVGRDDRYFQDIYQGIPWNGYTKMAETMLNNKKIEVQLNTSYDDIKNELQAVRIFYTGSIDEFFNYEFGMLPYRSLKFDILDRPYPTEQPTATINYPSNYDWTRIVEHRHFLNQLSHHTVLSYEYPEAFKNGSNERYYPISSQETRALYDKYLEKSASLKNVYFLGRLGDYKYYNMDQCVKRSLEIFERIKNGK